MITTKHEALEAVQLDGMQLRDVIDELQSDREVVLAAIENNPHAFQFASDELQKDPELLSMIMKDDSYYFDIVNPASGLQYSIPLLNTAEPGYFYKYVNAMKLKERSPQTFEKMLNWD